MTTTTPPLTPNSGPIKLNPTIPSRPPAATHVAGKVAPPPDFTPYDPPLSPGEAQVLRAERPRLFRMLDRRGDDRVLDAVLVLLEDLAGQAPAVDEQLAREGERRRAAGAARPTVGSLLSKRSES